MRTIGKIISKEKVCHYVYTPDGFVKISPFVESDHTCVFCGGKNHITYGLTVANGIVEHAWICKERICRAYAGLFDDSTSPSTKNPERALEWAKLCEISGIGDLFYDVTFENVQQSDAKLDYMRRFVANPTGFIVMQGDKGCGKTYSAMGMCELFTRTSPHCMFMTQKKLLNDWHESHRWDSATPLDAALKTTQLLVIDDFGMTDISKDFLSFFMDLIDTRMQWKKRGTVITTNLDNEHLVRMCGDAICDRLNTGVTLKFVGNSRRETTII